MSCVCATCVAWILHGFGMGPPAESPWVGGLWEPTFHTFIGLSCVRWQTNQTSVFFRCSHNRCTCHGLVPHVPQCEVAVTTASDLHVNSCMRWLLSRGLTQQCELAYGPYDMGLLAGRGACLIPQAVQLGVRRPVWPRRSCCSKQASHAHVVCYKAYGGKDSLC